MGLSKRLSVDTFNYGLGQVLPKVIGFLLIPLYTSYLTPAEFGIVDLTVTAGAFIMVVMRLSVPSAITRFYFDYRDSPKEQDYITSIYWFIILLSAVTGLIFLIIGFAFLDSLIPGLPYIPFFVLIVVSSFFNSNSEIQRRLLQVRGRSAYTSMLNIVVALINISLAILLVVWFKLGALGIVLATVTAAAIFYIQAQLYLKKDLSGQFRASMIKESFLFSIVLFPYHLYGQFALILTKSILSAFATLSAVGILAIATKFTQPLTIILTAFGTAFTPTYLSIRSKNVASENKNLSILIKRVWFSLCLLFIIFFLFCDLFLILIPSTPAYIASGLVMKILSLGFLPQMFYAIFTNELLYRKANKKMLIINLIGVSLTVSLSWLLIPRYNEMGAAFAIIVPSFTGALLMFLYAKESVMANLQWKFLVSTVVASVTLVVIDFLVLRFISNLVMSVGIKIALVFLFFAAFFFYDGELRASLKGLFGKLRR